MRDMTAAEVRDLFAYNEWANARVLSAAEKVPAEELVRDVRISHKSILGTLLHNGIPILSAMRIAKDSTGNRVLTEAIDKSADNIRAGDALATPLSACKYFPRDVVEMIAVGEESNNLETVLVQIAEGLEKRTSRQLDLFVRLLEPLMLLVMAVAVLIVVAGLLLPIFKMSSTVR